MMSNFLRIEEKRVEQVLPTHIKESDVISNNAKKVFAALLDLHFSLDEAKKLGYVYLSNDELRKIVQIQKNAMLSAVKELTDLEYPLIRREIGLTREKGERAQATRYYINWNNINFPLIKLTFAGLYAQFAKPLEKPTGTVDVDIEKEIEIDIEKEIEIDIEKEIEIDIEKEIELEKDRDKKRKNKKVEIKKDYTLNKDTLKMEFENELKNEFENEIEKIIPSNEKINLDEEKTKKGKLLNSSTLENENVERTELNNIPSNENTESRQSEQNTNTKAENSPRNALNLKGVQTPSPSNNKRSEGLEMANKTNNNNTKAKANEQKAKSGSGLSNNAADGQTSSPSINKRSEGLEIALNPIFNVICDLSDQDKTEMNRAFEEEETNQFADEQEKAIFDAPRQQREYQEEQQEQKENALNYKEVFEEYEKKIKYCRNSESLNAIYNLFKKYAQQVAQKLDGQELEQAAQDYDKVKEAKDNKLFSLKAKSL